MNASFLTLLAQPVREWNKRRRELRKRWLAERKQMEIDSRVEAIGLMADALVSRIKSEIADGTIKAELTDMSKFEARFDPEPSLVPDFVPPDLLPPPESAPDDASAYELLHSTDTRPGVIVWEEEWHFWEDYYQWTGTCSVCGSWKESDRPLARPGRPMSPLPVAPEAPML